MKVEHIVKTIMATDYQKHSFFHFLRRMVLTGFVSEYGMIRTTLTVKVTVVVTMILMQPLPWVN